MMETEVHVVDVPARIRSLVEEQRHQLLAHPFFTSPRHAVDKLPKSLLLELAFHQYADSILWVPMLSLLHTHATSPRLRRAIAENIAHETGLVGHSHVDLARTMLRSLGVRDLRALPTTTFARSASQWLQDDFFTHDDGEIAGWLLTAETLVPVFFARIVDAIRALGDGVDTRYFDAHVAVDTDEHAHWMAESVADVLHANPHALGDIERGMRDAFAEVLEVPSRLVARAAKVEKGGAR